MLRFIEDDLPLLIIVSPMGGYDEAAIREMNARCEGLWTRGARYALISSTPKGASTTGARGRKLIAEWANRPRVRQMSKQHCVASATIVENAVARGALTAILWLWTPPAPHKAVAAPGEAIDWCMEHIERAGLALPRPAPELRRHVARVLREV